METLETKKTAEAVAVLTSEMLLNHWQGHRQLTRRMIEAFPDDKLFSHSIGGMRPFAQLVVEMLTMSAPGIRGVVERAWPGYSDVENRFKPTTKQELLRLWDNATREINDFWPKISEERFRENDKFFGQYEGPIYWSILYLIDNEIHHRGQGYVYLRSLGIEPPPFWDRSQQSIVDSQ
jgi:uncharacterized damage-inducible protein DinB